jgi:hypothetical protein
MKRFILLFLLLAIARWSSAQGLLDRNKQQVRAALNDYSTKNRLKTKVKETDSSMSLLVRDNSPSSLDLYFHFSRSGRCDQEKRTSNCDSCFQKYLRETLAKEKFEWIKLSDSLYITAYSKKMMMQTKSANGNYTYLIRKVRWKQKQYDALLKRKS